MSEQEFEDFINRTLENVIVKCDRKQIPSPDQEQCKRCMQNVGFNENKQVMCIRDFK